MSDNLKTPEKTGKGGARPWFWIPTLYLAEGFPMILVTYVSLIMYTKLGVSLTEIAVWTSLLGFAWTIKPLWGPLVETYWTKRRWTILMQIGMGLLLIGVGVILQFGVWWWGSLFLLAIVALFSATHDIAADGYYIDALNENQQSFFVGIRSTFYRISMILCQGILIIAAGVLEQKTGPQSSELVVKGLGKTELTATPPVPQEGFAILSPNTLDIKPGQTTTVTIALKEKPVGEQEVTVSLVPANAMEMIFPLGSDITLDKKYEHHKFDETNWNIPQDLVISADKNLAKSTAVKFRASSGNLPLTWGICFGGMGLLMLLLGLYHVFSLKEVQPDKAHDGGNKVPFVRALFTIALVVIVPVGIFWGLDEAFKAGMKWMLKYSHLTIPDPIISLLAVLFTVGTIWAAFLVQEVRQGFKQLARHASETSGVPFYEIFGSFFSRPGIGRMVAFLLLYRLGEALLVRMSGPFLLKPVTEGGMGLTQQQLGIAYGTVGMVAMLCGGVLGGIVASRGGLKKWIFAMCLAINVPDVLYALMAYYQPESFKTIMACVAMESFGYGFGFTAYMLYMLYIADTGEHKTSHFALCTGFMSLGMMLPGMISGGIADSLVSAFPQAPNLGWTWFFVIVCIATLPGFIMLKFIPLDAEFGRRKVEHE